MTKKMKKGFTITELVIVIAVIAILAAVLIPTFSYVVGNAKKSAALQTCKNGLTNYQSLVGTDNDPDNDDTTGMVFVYDGYAYAYISGALQYVGELEDLAVYKAGATAIEGTLPETITAGSPSGTDQITINITPDQGSKQETIIKDSDLAAAGAEMENKKAENVYFYSIEVNSTTYVGYFTVETSENPALVSESAIYSRVAGFVSKTGTGAMEIILPTA